MADSSRGDWTAGEPAPRGADAPSLRLVSILGGDERDTGALMACLAQAPDIVVAGPLYRWVDCAGRADPDAGFMQDAPFWREVLAAYRRLHHGVPFTVLRAVHERLESRAGLLPLLCGRAPRWAIEIHHNHTYKLARAVASVSGRSVIVERANHPGRTRLLLRNPCLESRIVSVGGGFCKRGLDSGLALFGAPRGRVLGVGARDLSWRFEQTVATVRRFAEGPSGAAG